MSVIKEKSGFFSLVKYVFWIGVVLFLLPDSNHAIVKQKQSEIKSGMKTIQTSMDTVEAVKDDILSLCERREDICENSSALAKDVKDKVLDGVLVVIDNLKNNQIVDTTVRNLPLLSGSGHFIESKIHEELGYEDDHSELLNNRTYNNYGNQGFANNQQGFVNNQGGYVEPNYYETNKNDFSKNVLEFEIDDATTTSGRKSNVMGSAQVKQILSTAAINGNSKSSVTKGVDTLTINDLIPEWSGPNQKS